MQRITAQGEALSLSPLPVVNRGFGGAQIHQVTYYADRIVLPYGPRGVVLYAGENDIAGAKFSRKKEPEEVLEAFRQFCETTHGELPEVPIHYILIKPPKLRREHWPKMEEANRLIEAFCEGDDSLSIATCLGPSLRLARSLSPS